MIKAPTYYSLYPFDFMMAQRENLRLVVNMMLGIQVLSSDGENSNNHSHAYQKPTKKVNELYYGWEIIRETRPFIVLSSRTFSVFALTLKSSAPFTFFFLLIFFNVHPTRSYFKLLITSLHVFTQMIWELVQIQRKIKSARFSCQ